MRKTGQSEERGRLLLVGGNGSTSARFARAWPYLEERFRPTLVEIAGQGGRQRAALPTTFDGFADDLAEGLERAAEGERALCYGQGIGGLLLAHAVRRIPGVPSRLVLHAPVGAHLARRALPRLLAWTPLAAAVRSLLASRVGVVL